MKVQIDRISTLRDCPGVHLKKIEANGVESGKFYTAAEWEKISDRSMAEILKDNGYKETKDKDGEITRTKNPAIMEATINEGGKKSKKVETTED